MLKVIKRLKFRLTVISWFVIRNTYLVFHPVPGTELLNSWLFLWYVNEVTFGKPLDNLRMGLTAREINHVIRSGWISTSGNDLISYYCVNEASIKTQRTGSETFQLGQRVEEPRVKYLARAWKSPTLPLHLLHVSELYPFMINRKSGK